MKIIVKLVANYFKSQGVNAQYINPKDAGLLSDEYGNARVLPQHLKTCPNLKILKEL